MKQIILKLKEEIKKSSTMSEGVTWYNTQEDNKIINEIEDFLILHNAQLQYILNELQLFNGDTVKLVNDWSELENSGLDTKLINWNTDSSTDDTNQ